MLTAASRPARKIPLCVLLGSKILFLNIVDKIDSARLVLNLLNFSAIKGKLEEIRQETTCFEEFSNRVHEITDLAIEKTLSSHFRPTFNDIKYTSNNKATNQT